MHNNFFATIVSIRTPPIFPILLMYALQAFDALALSLDEAIVMGLNAYETPLVDLEQQQLTEARNNSEKFKFAVRPSINLNHDGALWVAQRYGLDASIDMGTKGSIYAGISRQQLPISDSRNDQHNITYVVPLFRRPLLDDMNNPKFIDRQLERLQRRLVQTQQELVLRIAETFYQAAILEQQARVLKDELALKEKRFSIANNSQSEKLKALTISELELEEARFQSESKTIEANSAKEELEQLIKQSLLDDSLELSSPTTLPNGSDDLVFVALENRLDYADALVRLDEAHKSLLLNRRYALPEMNLRLGYSADQFESATSSSDSERFNIGISGANLIPSSNNRANYAYDLERARIERSILEQQVRRDVGNAYNDLLRSDRLFKLTERRLTHYQKQRSGFEKLYELGRISYEKVEEAQSQFNEAQLALLNAQQNRVLAEYRLKAAMGTLIEVPAYLLPAKGEVGLE